MNFYFLPSRRCIVLWSQKCACTSLSRWIKHSFEEAKSCAKGTSARTHLAKTGHNFKDINNLQSLTCGDQPVAKNIVVSYRDPASRITSSFVNKFHVYQNRTIFDGQQEIQGFSWKFSNALIQDLHESKGVKRKPGDFSLKEMILFLYRHRDGLDAINAHFTPQLHSQLQLKTIKSMDRAQIRIFPLRVENFRNDLKTINKRFELKYLPASVNSTVMPGKDWVFSESDELINWPVSQLFLKKVIPKAKSLQSALDRDADFKAKYMEVFQHDYALMSWLESRRQSK